MKKENKLILIPKVEKYIEYVLDIVFKLSRTEKISIGNEFKKSMYKILENIMYLNKISSEDNIKNIEIVNKIDALLNLNRMYLRIMKKNKWIDEKSLTMLWD